MGLCSRRHGLVGWEGGSAETKSDAPGAARRQRRLDVWAKQQSDETAAALLAGGDCIKQTCYKRFITYRGMV